MSDDSIGRLFPLGGPVRRELIVGRDGEIEDLARRMGEGLSAMLVGPRRIGKTTVCDAVCGEVEALGALVVRIDVPERTDSETLLQLIVDSCSRLSLQDLAGKALGIARPLVEEILSEAGLPLDLASLDSPSQTAPLPSRTILDLPGQMARRQGRRALLYLDELQRVASYADGGQVLGDLVDLYGASEDVVLLVDGSEERALETLFAAPMNFGKLVDRVTLAERIPLEVWRGPLIERFAAAGLELSAERRDDLLTFSDGHPYATMAAARYTALAARRTDTDTIGEFDVRMGIDEAERHLEDDRG